MSRKLLGAAAVIQNNEGHVLLVKHNYGKYNWELPGGLAEQNESAKETAQRETIEETGLEVEAERLTGIYYDPVNDMHHFAFTCRSVNDRIPLPSSSEILECRYCSIDDLPRPISDFTIQRIIHALNPDNDNLFHIIGPRQWTE